MHSAIRTLSCLALAAVPAMGIGVAAADEAGSSPAPFADAAVVDEAVLGTVAGRENLTLLAHATKSSTVRNNSVNGNSVTGAINLDGQAFQNLAGLAVINANTGNNVSINASMLMNIAISPQQ